MFFAGLYVLCGLRLTKLKTEGQTIKQKTSAQTYKTEIKILANNPGLASLIGL